MKLKNLLNESSKSYKRMNIGEEEQEKKMTSEEKKAFLEAVSAYKKFGEAIYRNGDLMETYSSIKNIVENANKVTLEETGDWFDRVTVNRHMKSMNESFKVFTNTIKEVHTLQQRMESTYDEIGEVLSKYYEIKEGNEFGAERAKAIAKGEDEFEVDGKKYPVKGVDKDDKENAKEFTNESFKLKDILNESFGIGELPSSKLKTMKVSAKEMMDSVDKNLNEGTKYLKVQDKKGKQIMQAIDNNGKMLDFSRYGMDIVNVLPVLRNGIKMALNHKYKLHTDIGDVPKKTHRHYYRFNSKKEMQNTLDNTKKVFKEWLTLIDAAIKRPSKASLKRVEDKWREDINIDAGTRGTLFAHIVQSGEGKSSFI